MLTEQSNSLLSALTLAQGGNSQDMTGLLIILFFKRAGPCRSCWWRGA